METEQALKEAGFERHEATLYLLLLKLGESTAVTLAREASLHRRTVYDTMESLQEKGLVSLKMKKGVKHYTPASPEVLLGMLKEKEQLLQGMMPRLLEAFRSEKKKLDIRISEGSEAMKAVFRGIINENQQKATEILMLGAGWKAPRLIKYSLQRYIELLLDMKWRLIEPDLQRIRKEVKKWGMLPNTRFLPRKYLSPLSILTYSDKMILVLMEEEPVLIQITGREYANAFRKYFDVLWRVAKK